MTNPRRTVATAVCAAALGVTVLGASVPACSTKSGPGSPPGSSSAPARATVMVEGHTHTISGAVECSTSPAVRTATPPESGTQTTRVSARDDSASVTLSLSDSTPPDVNGFSISLKSGNTKYQMPYQPVESPTQVEATRQGKSYTLTGTGHAVIPGQSGMRELPFGVHVTCP
ncbi:lipoprotein LpqH [Mycobacterium decipiens]|uniref:Lipoprotein LppO n=1 Tax=Mycobacterium decipiens TaxID=1430326 RepID=A0A1X2LPP9_9MYCO|nr:lipoprotein LpqH [Mycobacterium decipiens]OSC37654.1 hypothetical protein B8W66_21160 [Mycobacterium decipiens]